MRTGTPEPAANTEGPSLTVKGRLKKAFYLILCIVMAVAFALTLSQQRIRLSQRHTSLLITEILTDTHFSIINAPTHTHRA